MRAIRIHEFGGPEVLRLEEMPIARPGEGEMLVEVRVAGVNFFDTQLRSGLYKQPLPVGLGNEGAGVVQEVGPGAADFAPGDRIGWVQTPGSYATHLIVPAAKAVKLPEGVSFADAATVLFQGMTAHHLALATYPLTPGDSCIVHSAAGGVGTLLCQIAKNAGAFVIGTVSSNEKLETARSAGADHIVVYTREDLAAEARRLTGGTGVNVVYDAVGLETFKASLDSLAPRGYLALYGEASGLVPPFDVRELLFRGSLYLTRTGMNHYMATPEEFQMRAGDVLTWLAEGKIRAPVRQSFPLAEAADAHRAIETRSSVGKKVLMI